MRDWPLNNPSLCCSVFVDGVVMGYRCEATSVAGFVQQLAVSYVGHGYWFYVTGRIPDGKDPGAVDTKLIEKYDLAVGKTTRARRKAAGLANAQYIRHGRFFVLLATHGRHKLFEHERSALRDARDVPIKFGGYSISYRAGHPHVRIEDLLFRKLKAYFLDVAVHRSRERLEGELSRVNFEPYAPVRSQIHGIIRAVNTRRELAQYEPVSPSCVRMRRRILKPFEHQQATLEETPVVPLNEELQRVSVERKPALTQNA